MRIEPPGENTVLEVTYDGQEIVQPPLTMSENLSKQARKIDFSQESEMEVDEQEETDEEMKSFNQPGMLSNIMVINLLPMSYKNYLGHCMFD